MLSGFELYPRWVPLTPNTDWQNIYNENDANITYNSFLNKYFDIYNSCFLLKKVKAWKCSLKTPWLYIGGLAKIH